MHAGQVLQGTKGKAGTCFINVLGGLVEICFHLIVLVMAQVACALCAPASCPQAHALPLLHQHQPLQPIAPIHHSTPQEYPLPSPPPCLPITGKGPCLAPIALIHPLLTTVLNTTTIVML